LIITLLLYYYENAESMNIFVHCKHRKPNPPHFPAEFGKIYYSFFIFSGISGKYLIYAGKKPAFIKHI